LEGRVDNWRRVRPRKKKKKDKLEFERGKEIGGGRRTTPRGRLYGEKRRKESIIRNRKKKRKQENT